MFADNLKDYFKELIIYQEKQDWYLQNVYKLL